MVSESSQSELIGYEIYTFVIHIVTHFHTAENSDIHSSWNRNWLY